MSSSIQILKTLKGQVNVFYLHNNTLGGTKYVSALLHDNNHIYLLAYNANVRQVEMLLYTFCQTKGAPVIQRNDFLIQKYICHVNILSIKTTQF